MSECTKYNICELNECTTSLFMRIHELDRLYAQHRTQTRTTDECQKRNVKDLLPTILLTVLRRLLKIITKEAAK